jgi:hypothetical protein
LNPQVQRGGEMNPVYDYSILTEGVIVFTWAVPAWYMYITFRESGRSQRSAWTAFLVPLLWAALAWYLVKADLDWGDSPIFQARPLIIMGVSVALTAIFAKRILGPGLDQRWLIGLQLFRAIGMLFVLEWSRGNLPAVFALPAGWGDLAAAVTALVVLVGFRGREIPAGAVRAVSVVGIADAISAFFFGFFSSDTPVQLFSQDFPNRVIEYPTGLIPLFLICFAVCMHVLSLAELRRSLSASGKE